MTDGNLLSNQFIEDWLPYDARIHNSEKFIILTEDVALLTKKFHGNEGKFGKIYMVCLMFLQLTKLGNNVFQIDMPPSFLLRRIGERSVYVLPFSSQIDHLEFYLKKKLVGRT